VFCVVVLPRARERCVREIAVELDERMDEVASHRPSAEECRELGEVEEPVGVPARPVGVVSVDDPVDDVVGLRRLVEEGADGGGGILCVDAQLSSGS
jgi:hypothetical protein